MAIIRSLLENDLYKFSMGQVIFHQFPGYTTTWTFKCRNENVVFTPEMAVDIEYEIKHYCGLRFTDDELDYLLSIPWMKKSYVDFLRLWRPMYGDFKIELTADGRLDIETEGTWLNTSMYEIPVLAIVSEVYYRHKYRHEYDGLHEEGIRRLREKSEMFSNSSMTFSEFGLRRRFSAKMQEAVVQTFIADKEDSMCNFVGTSNVYLAKKYGIKPVGTMAHEFIMCVGQGEPSHNPSYSNKFAMESWVKEYGVENGIYLTDTIKTETFLLDFDKKYATLFSGVRHDSGDPKKWGKRMLKHYKELGIDPTTKTLLFSDSLDFTKAWNLHGMFMGRINTAFGIGTYLTNDTGAEPLNIVMKVTKVNGMPAAKISDTEGKGMCKSKEYVDYLNRSIDWRLRHGK